MSAKIEEIKNYIKEIYPEIYELIIKNISIDRPKSFRINNINSGDADILGNLKEQGFIVTEGPIKNSYISEHAENKRISDTTEFQSGEIYIQELSSMLPVNLLVDPSFDGYILDIAAAPGSKTTQISSITNNKGRILAIEKDHSRFMRLKDNIDLHNCDHVRLIKGNGIKFDKRNPGYENFFDKAIVDVPCSSEGRFNLEDASTYKYWNYKKRKIISSTQKGLLMSAYRMLKPGGELIYSTCTFGLEENEVVINWLLKRVPEATVVPIELDIENKVAGFTSWKDKSLNSQISNTTRILPNELFGGFYLARIKKWEKE